MNFNQLWMVAVTIVAIAGAVTASPYIPQGVVIRDIKIEGVHAVPTADIPQIASLNSKVGLKFIDTAVYQDVNTFYLTGFFKRVEAVPITSPNQTTLFFKVEEFPTINSIQFFGADAISRDTLLALTDIRPGNVMNTVSLQRYKDSIEHYYQDKGYDISQVLQMSLSPSRDLLIDITEGRIRDIEIWGVSPNLGMIASRELRSKKGGYFNTRRLREDRERLLKLGYFSDVLPPHLGESLDKRQVKFVFEVKPRKTNALDAGLEYFEQSGEQPLTGFIRTELHHLAIDSDSLSIKVQAAWAESSPYVQGYAARYTQPWIWNWMPLSMSIGAWSERHNEFLTKDRNNTNRAVFSNQRRGADLELSYPFSDEFTLSTRAKKERVEPDSSSGLANYSINSLAVKADYHTIKNMANPRNGVYVITTYELGGDLGIVKLGGITFKRVVGSIAGFTEIGPNGVLACKFTAGEFNPDSDNSVTFETEGFDLGGPNTLRGYKESFPAFVGNRELLFNFEYRHDMGGGLQWVLFWDTGQAFFDSWPSDTSGFKSGYGVGLRYATPVGAIRLDLATGEAVLIHFGLGQTF